MDIFAPCFCMDCTLGPFNIVFGRNTGIFRTKAGIVNKDIKIE